LAGGSPYQTLRRLGAFYFYYKTTQRRRPPPAGVRASNLVLWGDFCHPPFFNYHPARKEGEATCCLFLFILLQRIEREREREREGYGGTSTRLYEARARACYQTVRRLSSLTLQPNPDDDDDDDDGCCCCCCYRCCCYFLNIIIITHLFHSHIHCDLDHSRSKLTLHDPHFFLQPTETTFPSPIH